MPCKVNGCKCEGFVEMCHPSKEAVDVQSFAENVDVLQRSALDVIIHLRTIEESPISNKTVTTQIVNRDWKNEIQTTW